MSFRSHHRLIIRILYGWLVLTPFVGWVSAQEESRIPAKLKMAETGQVRDVFLTGRKGEIVYYRFKDAQGVVNGTKTSEIAAARLDLEYEREAVEKAAAQGDWLEAAKALFPAVLPALAFLDLPDNEPPRLAMEAAAFLMRAGVVQRKGTVPAPGNTAGAKEYTAARRILRAVTTATHSGLVDEAAWRAVTCLVMTGQLEEAEEEIETLPVPDPTESGYAYSCLARSQLHRARGNHQRAMQNAVQALAFETKDIDSFPEALFLSAQCYQDLEEWYRARDTYFEVARLFGGTDWFQPAVDALRKVMSSGHAAAEEKEELHKVFFGTTEDVNQRVNAFLASLDSAAAAGAKASR